MPPYLRAAAFENCTSCGGTARSSSTRWNCTARRRAWASLPDLYVETLTGATDFRYQRADAFVDVDPRFYAARYLRAWQLQALLNETLRSGSTRTGGTTRRRAVDRSRASWHGQRELATEQATAGGREGNWEFEPLKDIEANPSVYGGWWVVGGRKWAVAGVSQWGRRRADSVQRKARSIKDRTQDSPA